MKTEILLKLLFCKRSQSCWDAAKMGAKRLGQIRVIEVSRQEREEGNVGLVVAVSEQGSSQQERDAGWQGQEPQAEEFQLGSRSCDK